MGARGANRYWPSTMLVVLCALCLTGVARAEDESTEALYTRWAAKCHGRTGSPISDEEAQLFRELLTRKDADTFFVQGIHAKSEAVRWQSRIALAKLKTDLCFQAFAQLAHDPNPSVRMQAVRALEGFREDRCVPILLNVLQKDIDLQIRREVAATLRLFPAEKVKAGLLEALKNDPPVAVDAAHALAFLGVPEAIEPTYQLVLATKGNRQHLDLLSALSFHRHKRAVTHLVDLCAKLAKEDEVGTQVQLARMEGFLTRYVLQAYDEVGPVPETGEQWRDWWTAAEPLFTDDMQLKKPVVVPPEQLGKDASQLEFRIVLDAKTYRPADPIAIDFSLHNRSSSPLRTIPPVTNWWWPTMAYGILLERIDDSALKLFESKPSGYYMGSYSGPPSFQTLVAGQTLSHRNCLHNWMRWQSPNHWPLPEGKYRLTITFDNREYVFATARAKEGELLHQWQASPVEFTIQGDPRTDTKELLGLIAEKSKSRFLVTDLDSKNEDRQRRARYIVAKWGDDRLAPLLGDKFRQSWGSDLPHYVPLQPNNPAH
jgi:hypothetical protein